MADLETIRIPEGELAEWFNHTLQTAFKNTSEVQRQQRLTLKKRVAEFEAIQERLLNAYLAGTIDEQALAAKTDPTPRRGRYHRRHFGHVRGSTPRGRTNGPRRLPIHHCVVCRPKVEPRPDQARFKDGPISRRKILDAVSLNRLLGVVTLVLEEKAV